MPIWPIPKIIDDNIRKTLSAQTPKSKNAKTGSVAPGSGIKNILAYMSCIVLELLKYLIQYTSYNIIKRNAATNIIFELKFTPQNKENITTNT